MILYALLFMGGIGIAVYYAGNIAFQAIGASASLVAIFAGLMTLIRDEIERYHNFKMQENEHKFSLGATSHMAQVIFDKHVEFSEEYMNKFTEIVDGLFRYGPTDRALGYASELYKIRRKYVLWISEEIEERLDGLESALRRMGVSHTLLKDVSEADDRSRIYDEIYGLFRQICEISRIDNKDDFEKEENKIARSKIIQHLRDLLGASDFTLIRRKLIEKSKNHQN